MTQQDVILYIVIPFGVTIVSTAFVAICRWFGLLFFKDKLIVRNINLQNSNEVNKFIELYNKRIVSDMRICAEDVIDPCHTDGIFHYLYILKRKNEVVGFIKFMHQKEDNYLFIAYICINKSDDMALAEGVEILINKVFKNFINIKNGARNIYTEIEKGVNNRKTALFKLIARNAKKYQKTAYIYDFDYIQPRMQNDAAALIDEKKLSLVWIPISSKVEENVSQNAIIKICRMLYNDIYYPSCNKTVAGYEEYLDEICSRYCDEIGTEVNIITA